MSSIVPPTKVCTKCKCELPIDSYSKKGKGLQPICKSCAATWQRQYRANNPETVRQTDRRRSENPKRKEWKRCWQHEHAGELNERRRIAHALNPSKRLEVLRRWWANNPDKRKQYIARWHSSDKYKATCRRFYLRHRERILQYHKEYRNKNKSYTQQRMIEYRKSKPYVIRALSQRRRAREMNAEGNYTAQDIAALYEQCEDRCMYCGITLFGEYHVDHVQPLARGGSNNPDNLAITCPTCNLSKHDKTFEEWQAVRGW